MSTVFYGSSLYLSPACIAWSLIFYNSVNWTIDLLFDPKQNGRCCFTGWKNWTKSAPDFIDSRCSIKLKQFDLTSDSPTLELWKNTTFHLGSIKFDIAHPSDQKISVISNIECKNGEKSCTKEFPVSLGADLKNMECKLTFAGSTWTQRETNLICGSVGITLTDDEGVLSVIHQIKYTKLNRIGSYNFHCPGNVPMYLIIPDFYTNKVKRCNC